MREHFTRIAPFRENGPETPSASRTFYLALFCWEKEAAGLEATRGCRLETRRGDGAGLLITGLSHSPLRGFCRLKLLLTHGPIPFVRFHGAAASRARGVAVLRIHCLRPSVGKLEISLTPWLPRPCPLGQSAPRALGWQDIKL